ncbi:MAG: phosphoribosylformylglycinamidine cyclo-ligase, partial [Bacteroidetes bacterium]|nr:phosphoribosylformylglycinamidine cyclo-ligase [Bacteroidota bacterium]
VLQEIRQEIHGLIHCSGGAQTKVLNFVNDLHIIKDDLFSIPPLFRIIQEQSGTEWQEMYKVFNMGHRFEIYLPEKYSSTIIDICSAFNLDAKIIGHCEPSNEKKLTIRTDEGDFFY